MNNFIDTNPQQKEPIWELFPIFDHHDDIPDAEILYVLTQIENTNQDLAMKSNDNQPKPINLSNVSNVAHITRNPMMPTRYFPSSTIAINYNFSK